MRSLCTNMPKILFTLWDFQLPFNSMSSIDAMNWTFIKKFFFTLRQTRVKSTDLSKRQDFSICTWNSIIFDPDLNQFFFWNWRHMVSFNDSSSLPKIKFIIIMKFSWNHLTTYSKGLFVHYDAKKFFLRNDNNKLKKFFLRNDTE